MRMLKTARLCAAVTLLAAAAAPAGVFAMEKGDPSADYDWDMIRLPGGERLDVGENHTVLFINGTLAAGHEVITKDNIALAPVRAIAEGLGASVGWNGAEREVLIEKDGTEISFAIGGGTATVNGAEAPLAHPAALYGNAAYVPLRFTAEALGASVAYAERMSCGYTYYYDTRMPVSPPGTIVRDFANIFIDEAPAPEAAATAGEAMERTKAFCLEGLANFKRSLNESAGEPGRYGMELAGIEKEIGRMMYLGEVSRYHKFTIGAYDILYDKYNGRIFFVRYSSGIRIAEADVNDPGLFMAVFIVG